MCWRKGQGAVHEAIVRPKRQSSPWAKQRQENYLWSNGEAPQSMWQRHESKVNRPWRISECFQGVSWLVFVQLHNVWLP